MAEVKFVREAFCALGWTSHLGDNRRWLQIDLDGVDEAKAYFVARSCASRHGHAVLLKTRNGYHVNVYKPLTPKECLKELRYFEPYGVDELFIMKQQKKGYTTLRVSPKFSWDDSSGELRITKVSPAPEPEVVIYNWGWVIKGLALVANWLFGVEFQEDVLRDYTPCKVQFVTYYTTHD